MNRWADTLENLKDGSISSTQKFKSRVPSRTVSAPLKNPPTVPPRPTINSDSLKIRSYSSISKKTAPKTPSKSPILKQPSYSNGDNTNLSEKSLSSSTSDDNSSSENNKGNNNNADGQLSHRTKIAHEIYETELAYVTNLEILLTCYKAPLLQNSAQINCTPEQINLLFPKNLEMIYEFNKEFCTQLENEIIKNNDSSKVGETFVKYGHFLKMYNEYSSDYQASLNHYNKLVKDNQHFNLELKKCKEMSKIKLGFEDLIIMPVQRVPRYNLLLTDLIKHTPDTSTDYNKLVEAQDIISQVGNYINESIRKSDNSKRLQVLYAKGANFDKLIDPQRFLIRDGVIKVEEKGKKETKHIFLFNDILVSIKDSIMKAGVDMSQPEYTWPLNLVWIYDDEKRTYIVGPNEQKMSFKKSKVDKFWINNINEQIQNWLKIQNEKNSNDQQSDDIKRFGEYTTSYNEKYIGEWVKGLKHGKGKCFFNGCIYEGEWENGKKSGHGVLTYSTGEVYIGSWKNDLQNGKGEIKRKGKDGSLSEILYSGNWVDGKFHGSGKLVYPNGDAYVGDFFEGRMCGQGTLTLNNGFTYDGQWKDDHFEGRGTLTYPNGIIYEGQFKNGMKNGKGEIRYPNGAKYYGGWLDDMKSGTGKFEYADSSVYEGEWLNDMPEGKGEKKWANGMVYTGMWSKGLRKGMGTCVYPDSSKYTGNWLDDNRHGQGTFMETDGSTYIGEWVNGRKEGKGTMNFANLTKYEGNWQNDKFHKSGVFTGNDESFIKMYDGEWFEGKMQGKGTVIFSNGDTYKGGMKDNKLHGTGVYTYKGDDESPKYSYIGKWNMGIREGKANISTSDKKEVLSGNCDNPNILSAHGNSFILLPQLPSFPLSTNIDTSRSYSNN